MSNIMITNMHYYFHHGYYDFLDDEKFKNLTVEKLKTASIDFNAKHEAMLQYNYSQFNNEWLNQIECDNVKGIVQYPGLVMGIGTSHEIGTTGEIAIGFSFDYVTGLPYLPGSSLKGILKDKFKYGEYIVSILKKLKVYVPQDETKYELYLKKLVQVLFGDEEDHGVDIFLDSYVEASKGILKLDYLAPHSRDVNKKDSIFSVNVLPMLRISPNKAIHLRFILKTSDVPALKDKENNIIVDGYTITKQQKLELFKQILRDFGIGAKTNVGYGNLEIK